MSLRRYAVMGHPVEHSLSPMIHQHFARQLGIDLVYERILGEDAGFEQQVLDFFQSDGRGLNITLPFKERAFAMATVASERARKARSANTLWWQDGALHADNTDGAGLVRDLGRYRPLVNQSLLILGAGGAARGIIAPLLAAEVASVTLMNRDPRRAQALQADFPDIRTAAWLQTAGELVFDLIINATSSSLTGEPLLLTRELGHYKAFCYDLSYDLDNATPFVASARAQDCPAVDGLGMLVEQAAEAFAIWHGIQPDAREALASLFHRH